MEKRFCAHQELSVDDIIKKLFEHFKKTNPGITMEEASAYALGLTPAELLLTVGMLF